MESVRKQRADYILAILVFGLIVFGLIMIYSVSKYYSLNITNNATDKLFLKKQLLMVCIGIVAWITFQNISYKYWQKKAGLMLLGTLFLLILPIILKPLGITSGYRWIVIGSINFQPSELAKLTFILYLSSFFAKGGGDPKKIKNMFLPFLAIVSAITLLMLFQKDLGTLFIFIMLSAVIFIASGAPLYQIFSAAGLASFGLWLAIKIEPYRMERLTTFLNPGNNNLGAGYHIRNALIAIGSGGIWGLGFGQSKQKYLYLPEAHTDSIFAIVCEELGYLRSSIIILAFVLIAARGFRIAKNAPDIFSALVATAITFWIFGQMAINISAMLSLVPLTGIPLPFISYGGTSLIVMMSAVGLLLNISKYSKVEAKRI